MSDDPEFSRRDFLQGLGAVVAASAAPKDVIETVTKAIGETIHPLAMERATDVWRIQIDWMNYSPDDLQGMRAEAIRHLTGLAEDLERDPETFGDKIRAYRDAARLLESGWTPPARAPAVEREVERALPLEGRTPPETPREATRTLTLAEHVDELRAELRGALDSRERNMIAAELKAAHAVLKEQDNRERETTRPEIESLVANAESPSARKLRDDLTPEQAERAREIGFIDFHSAGAKRTRPPDVAPSQLGAVDAKSHRDDFNAAVARLSAETRLPHTPAAGGEFVAGIYRQSLTLSSGRFAMIDDGLGFSLVPWTPELDRHLGRHVAGVAQESGGIEWSFGRKRGLEI